MKRTADRRPDADPDEEDRTLEDMEQPGDGVEGRTTLPEIPVEAELKALKEEKERLAAENTELRDQLLRRRADYENFRKRMERERQNVTEYAAMGVVRELLPVLDHLERAIATSPQDAQDEFHAGVRMIAKQFMEAMERFGLTPIEALGKPFDPNLHQAVDRVVTEEQPDNTVVEEWQRGYMFKDRLLRPAMVKVAVHP